jgi:hypothetical protein
MGPLNTPWLTFLAWIVTAGSVLGAVVWAIWLFKPGEGER